MLILLIEEKNYFLIFHERWLDWLSSWDIIVVFVKVTKNIFYYGRSSSRKIFYFFGVTWLMCILPVRRWLLVRRRPRGDQTHQRRRRLVLVSFDCGWWLLWSGDKKLIRMRIKERRVKGSSNSNYNYIKQLKILQDKLLL